MKKLLATSFLALLPIQAFAASTRSDDGMLLVYLFLGICGLIIFLQLLPVFAVGFGIVKALFNRKGNSYEKLN